MFLALLGTFIQTPATLMCANRRTRRTVGWLWNQSPAIVYELIPKQTSWSNCQRHPLFVLKVSAVSITHSSLEITPDKRDLRSSFSRGGTREHIIYWWDELTVFYPSTLIPQADHQNSAVGIIMGNVFAHIWNGSSSDERPCNTVSAYLWISTGDLFEENSQTIGLTKDLK